VEATMGADGTAAATTAADTTAAALTGTAVTTDDFPPARGVRVKAIGGL
jgi:hypothetical protein